MRLDKYLKVSRIVKRRTVANELCDAGRVVVNDKVAKASYDVSMDDIIDVGFGGRNLKVKVKEIKEHVRKEDASLMYEIIPLEEKPEPNVEKNTVDSGYVENAGQVPVYTENISQIPYSEDKI